MNLQNIPSHDKTIRLMFRAKTTDITEHKLIKFKLDPTDEIEIRPDEWLLISNLKIGDKIYDSTIINIIDNEFTLDKETEFKTRVPYSIVGADYSAQEVRVLAAFANDKGMIDAYAHGKDLYAVIASIVNHNNYEDNLEFHPVTHELQPDGKKRRSNAKSVLLGLNYGMSTKSLAERIGLTVKEAQAVTDEFYKGFGGVKEFTESSQEMLKKYGYVTDLWGRRRRIPDAQLPEYEVKPKNSDSDFNPLIGSVVRENSKTLKKIEDYKKRLSASKWYKEINEITAQAEKEGFSVRNNKSFISRSLRQCLNARIQGSSASMTKVAMIAIDKDEVLNSLGFKLLVTVHDEVFGECPTKNADKAAKRLAEMMILAAKSKCGNVAWKCDPYVVKRWYEDECVGEVHNQYLKLEKKLGAEEAMTQIKEIFPMLQPQYVEQMCNETYKLNSHIEI